MKTINFLIFSLFFSFVCCKPNEKNIDNQEEQLLIGEWTGGNPTKAIKTFSLSIRSDKTYEAVYRQTNPREAAAGTWNYDENTKILSFTNQPAYKLLYVTKEGLAYQEVGQTSQYVFIRK